MKEHIRLVYMELFLVYSRIPVVRVRDIAYAVTFWLKSFPTKDSVSSTLIPLSIITGQSFGFRKHFLLDFGKYVHTHEDRDKSMESQTIEELALLPTGNHPRQPLLNQPPHWTRIHLLHVDRPAAPHFYSQAGTEARVEIPYRFESP